MKKKVNPKSVILTIILVITYVLCVVFNFAHMTDSFGSRKPGFATAGLFLLAAFVYVLYKRMNKRPLVVGIVFWSISLVFDVCSADVFCLQRLDERILSFHDGVSPAELRHRSAVQNEQHALFCYPFCNPRG